MASAKPVPHFIYSGEISIDELQRYINMINFLKGKILACKNDQFISSCTHVLVFSFSSSVKIMGGLASGKWLVAKEFIIQSYKKLKWLEEEEFEVKNNNNCARYRRLTQRKLYDGLTCFLETNNPALSKSLVRVLSAGGAIIVNRKDITENHIRVQLGITNKEGLESVQSLIGKTTPIVDLDYIKNTVFFKHDPNFIKPFLLNGNTVLLEGAFEHSIDVKPICLKKGYELVGKPSTPKQRVIRRTKAQQVSIANYFTDGNKEMAPCNKRLKFSTDIPINDEIAIIKEVKSHKKDENSDECSIAAEVKLEKNSSGDNSEKVKNIEEQRSVKDKDIEQSLDKDKEIEEINSQTEDIPNEIQNSQDEVMLTNEPNSSVEVIPQDESSEKSIFKKNSELLKQTKRALIEIDLPRMIKLVSKMIIHLNSSYTYLNRFHIPVYSYEFVDTKELNLKDSIYVSCYRDEELRIVSKRVGRHKLNVLKKVATTDNDAFENHLFVLDSLEYVKIRIQSDIVPNSTDVGSMFKHHIFKFPLKDASDKALNVFHYLVNRHPPRDRKMRDYYLRVFEIGSDLEVSHQHFKGWSFVRILLKDLVKESEEISYDVNMAVDLLIKLMELDLIYYNEKPVSVTSLLCYRIFWIGKSKTPNFMNDAVKELIQIWVDSHRNNCLVMQKIAKILGLMLEMLWKWSDIDSPFELSTWPMHSCFMPTANELLLSFKAPSADNLLKLVKSVRIPWQQFYLASLAFRSKSDPTESNDEISISSLKSKLQNEIKTCKKETCEKQDASSHPFPHKTKIQFISLLLESYSSAMGVKYCKTELVRQFKHSLRVRELTNPETEASFSDDSEERSSEERTESPSEQSEDNTVTFNIIRKIMKMFKKMSLHIMELNVLKKDCSHISNINFSNAL